MQEPGQSSGAQHKPLALQEVLGLLLVHSPCQGLPGILALCGTQGGQPGSCHIPQPLATPPLSPATGTGWHHTDVLPISQSSAGSQSQAGHYQHRELLCHGGSASTHPHFGHLLTGDEAFGVGAQAGVKAGT